MAAKEGFKRLSIAAAIVTSVVVFLSLFMFMLFTQRGPRVDLLIVAGAASLVCGLLVWGLIRLVAWVVAGFR